MNGTIKIFAVSNQLLRKAALMGASAAALVILATPAQADLITNGSFESTSVIIGGNPSAFGGQLGYNISETGWTVAPGGYTFVYAPGTADTGNAPIGQYGTNPLWGPNNGAPITNNLPAASPDGGNFLALDGDFQIAAISQNITGLTPGDYYTLGFYWAASQQYGFNGATVQAMNVCLGSGVETYVNTNAQPLSGNSNLPSNLDCSGANFSTPVYDLATHDFSGWEYESVDLQADASSEVLSFLAYGNVQVPPFALLDGVSLDPTPTPEPATLPLLITGLMGGLGVLRSRKWLKR